MNSNEFLTTEEVCEKLGRSNKQVYDLVENKSLSAPEKNKEGIDLFRKKEVDEILTFLTNLRDGKLDYVFFLSDYCGSVDDDPETNGKIDNRVAAWFYVNPVDALTQGDFIDVFITRDFKKFTDPKKITVPRVLDFLQRVELTNELNKLLGFKQHD